MWLAKGLEFFSAGLARFASPARHAPRSDAGRSAGGIAWWPAGLSVGRGSGKSRYCTELFTTTLSPHSEQMKASMAEDPGNVFSAPQWVQRTLQI